MQCFHHEPHALDGVGCPDAEYNEQETGTGNKSLDERMMIADKVRSIDCSEKQVEENKEEANILQVEAFDEYFAEDGCGAAHISSG
jgi:hypothetical protein